MPVTEFQEKVYNLMKQVPEGRVTTFASLARALNTSPRAVGNALRNNPSTPKIPCHRCVASNGYVSGYHDEVISNDTSKANRSKIEITRATEKPMQLDGKPKQETKGQRRKKTAPPSGMNVTKKLEILKKEGIEFDDRGMLVDKTRKVIWYGPWHM
jgi:methylated-DNA-[protein]-cysteine S-methyltransferase